MALQLLIRNMYNTILDFPQRFTKCKIRGSTPYTVEPLKVKVERDRYLFKACKIKSVSFVLYVSRLFACFFEITLLYSKALKHLHITAYDPDKTSIKSPMISVLSFPGAL